MPSLLAPLPKGLLLFIYYRVTLISLGVAIFAQIMVIMALFWSFWARFGLF